MSIKQVEYILSISKQPTENNDKKYLANFGACMHRKKSENCSNDFFALAEYHL